jgi:hypothetical protein
MNEYSRSAVRWFVVALMAIGIDVLVFNVINSIDNADGRTGIVVAAAIANVAIVLFCLLADSNE